MVTGKEEDAETEQKRNGNRAICMVSPASTRPSTSSPSRERRQTAIKIRFLLFSGSVRGYYVLGPPSRFVDRFVESGFEFRSGLRNPRVGTHAWARNAIVFRPDGHFKTNTCLSGTRKTPEKRSPYLPFFIPSASLPLDFSIFHACSADIYTLNPECETHFYKLSKRKFPAGALF